MMLVLLPLHEMINAGAATPNETLFLESFGKDLNRAWECCKVIFYFVFSALTKFRNMLKPEMIHVYNLHGTCMHSFSEFYNDNFNLRSLKSYI